MIDPRIVELGITINGVTTYYKDIWIEAKGTKVSSVIGTSCDITVLGLSTETRNFILRETRPNTPKRKRVSVELLVGRESYGVSSYYKGDVFRSSATPKPNLGINLKCITGYFGKENIFSFGGSETEKLSQIAKAIAQANGYDLSFEVTDKAIKSYSFTGSASKALSNLEDISGSDVYVDNNTLFIKDKDKPSKITAVFNVSDENGTLISSSGTESGIQVKMLFDPNVNIGSEISLISELNPHLNGNYVLFKVDYHVTSREDPFYLTVSGGFPIAS